MDNNESNELHLKYLRNKFVSIFRLNYSKQELRSFKYKVQGCVIQIS